MQVNKPVSQARDGEIGNQYLLEIMKFTLETERTAAGGWLAYCSQARDLLRERPVENPPVPDKQDRMTWDAAEGRDCARRD